MNDRDSGEQDVLADPHEQPDVPGDELGGGLGNDGRDDEEGATEG